MNLLALDVGSSSVKAAVLCDGKLLKRIARVEFPTQYDGVRAQVRPDDILRTIGQAIEQLRPRKIDLIAPTCMAPSWLAMDGAGNALTPIVTHQDRRSLAIATEIERRMGKARHLKLAGNRPIPGGISSTTAAWFLHNARGVMRRARVVGHLGTFLIHRLTGRRVTDPSNASFMGVYNTCTLSGWNEELCDAIGLDASLLPEVCEANQVAGRLTSATFGLSAGTPVLVGCMDTSAALMAIDAEPGRLLNSLGSTDVLAVCTDRPRPQERLLTRALGVGRKWVSVSTLAAGGSSLRWAHQQLFPDQSERAFFAMLAKLPPANGVRFEPYLSGERTCVEQKQAAFSGLTLSSTRQQMLAAVVDALAEASAARLPLLAQATRLSRDVVLTGGAGRDDIFHRDWPKTFRYTVADNLTMLGLARLGEQASCGRIDIR